MRTTKLVFVKVKKAKGDVNEWFFNIEGSLYSSLENLAEYTRMSYARDLYWIKEGFFFNDVEIPEEDVSIDEFQTEEGQHKAWNKHLSDLIKRKEEGQLLDCIPATEDTPVDEHQISVCYVFEIGGQELFFMDDGTSTQNTDISELFELENVTSEYSKKYMEAVNTSEIEHFVNTHTKNEIEEKFATKWDKENKDYFSMWEW